ncbi:low affinity iron permease family protein [Pseudomonas mangiferae]|uniref:Low affinity iron permease family protein n=1 Tax=Pseudomonas mangiferae TaxID=2593654 RepID=A0A553GW24_9PSED|nr:low affinity iron permease family protein [Pseudomonas mangiferae]TRX73718.1 low affinity iron permease family protein [Pseudomonas mangiferae]
MKRTPFTFHTFARTLAEWCGRARTFQLAIAIIVLWALTGPIFHFNDTWQLIINTGTTIVTFLMVFLIQNTQNRDTDAVHIKLDELLRATQGAHDQLLNLEEMDRKELEALKAYYNKLGTEAQVETSLEDLQLVEANPVEPKESH